MFSPDITFESDVQIVTIFLEVSVKMWDQAPRVPAGSFEHCFATGDGKDTPQALLGAPTLFDMTTQFRMIYSTTSNPFLCRVDDFEVPYFDLNVLRRRLNHCGRDHGIPWLTLTKSHGSPFAKLQH